MANKHADLKDILHRIVESLDLNPAHRAELHDSIDLHDDPEAQAARDAESQGERDAEVKELEARLAELRPAPAAAPADSAPSTPAAGPTPAVPRSATAPVATFTPAGA